MTLASQPPSFYTGVARAAIAAAGTTQALNAPGEWM